MCMIDNGGGPCFEGFEASTQLSPEHIFRFVAARHHISLCNNQQCHFLGHRIITNQVPCTQVNCGLHVAPSSAFAKDGGACR